MERKSTEQINTRKSLLSRFFGGVCEKNTGAVAGHTVIEPAKGSAYIKIKVKNLEWRKDKSGMYILIGKTPDGLIRVDIMNLENEPVRAIVGHPRDVYKQIARTFGNIFSAEHMAYIGYEISRCEFSIIHDTPYVQG